MKISDLSASAYFEELAEAFRHFDGSGSHHLLQQYYREFIDLDPEGSQNGESQEAAVWSTGQDGNESKTEASTATSLSTMEEHQATEGWGMQLDCTTTEVPFN